MGGRLGASDDIEEDVFFTLYVFWGVHRNWSFAALDDVEKFIHCMYLRVVLHSEFLVDTEGGGWGVFHFKYALLESYQAFRVIDGVLQRSMIKINCIRPRFANDRPSLLTRPRRVRQN